MKPSHGGVSFRAWVSPLANFKSCRSSSDRVELFTEWLPQTQDMSKVSKTGNFASLDPLHRSGDDRLSIALAELCLESIRENDLKDPFLALVDHGTPVQEVHAVREEVGGVLKERMSGRISGFSTCSMGAERQVRNMTSTSPLLENLLNEKKSGCHEMLVAQLFSRQVAMLGKAGPRANLRVFHG